MEQERLETPEGTLFYVLTRKRVRNLNLRVRADASVAVSAPSRMPKREIETFLREKARWIQKTQDKMRQKPEELPCRYTDEQCLALFTAVSDRVYPLFADLLPQKPQIAVREMKSRWGSCHLKKRKITLNKRLAEKPSAALEYVVLHEYVHFLHPNHGGGFHAEMARLMPDYKERRKLLR
ncbi:M48 family metallopeptidase [Ruminococcaceae bacterium OttesenSCG-928-I18]|nr:M48 family metallopeptidase [Ruminococcaceae bacterium OttesenSCG-928-I18]